MSLVFSNCPVFLLFFVFSFVVRRCCSQLTGRSAWVVPDYLLAISDACRAADFSFPNISLIFRALLLCTVCISCERRIGLAISEKGTPSLLSVSVPCRPLAAFRSQFEPPFYPERLP